MKQSYSFDQIAIALLGGEEFNKVAAAITSLSMEQYNFPRAELDRQFARESEDVNGVILSHQAQDKLNELRRKEDRKAKLRIGENHRELDTIAFSLDLIESKTRADRLRVIKESREHGEILCILIVERQIDIFNKIREGMLLTGTIAYLKLLQFTIARIQELALYVSTPLFDAFQSVFSNPLDMDAMNKIRIAMGEFAKRKVELHNPKLKITSSLELTPRKILSGYKEMAIALGIKANETNTNRLRYAAQNASAPIKLGTKGVPPKADRDELVAWHNSTLDQIAIQSSGNVKTEKKTGKDGERVFVGKMPVGQVKPNFRASGHLKKH